MIGIFLMYIIGKQFYKLAGKYEKNNWGFAILGIVTYYAGTFIAAFTYELLAYVLESEAMMSLPKFALSLLVVPFGLLACWVLYKNLEHRWRSPKTALKSDVIDDELIRKI